MHSQYLPSRYASFLERMLSLRESFEGGTTVLLVFMSQNVGMNVLSVNAGMDFQTIILPFCITSFLLLKKPCFKSS